MLGVDTDCMGVFVEWVWFWDERSRVQGFASPSLNSMPNPATGQINASKT
ncbi:hypothetical protein ACQ4M4_28215 [Leptolyngbya sp. AN02str]